MLILAAGNLGATGRWSALIIQPGVVIVRDLPSVRARVLHVDGLDWPHRGPRAIDFTSCVVLGHLNPDIVLARAMVGGAGSFEPENRIVEASLPVEQVRIA